MTFKCYTVSSLIEKSHSQSEFSVLTLHVSAYLKKNFKVKIFYNLYRLPIKHNRRGYKFD